MVRDPESEGILGGLEAYLDLMGVDSLDELEEEQLSLGLEEECDELAA
jgi:hypothetical protein